MHLRFAPRSGPLARQAARLVDRDADAVDPPRSVADDPAAYLGRLLDLGGSVAVARTLAELDSARSPAASTRLEPLSIGRARDDLRADFAELDARVRRAFQRLKLRHRKASSQDAQGLFVEPMRASRPSRGVPRGRGPSSAVAPAASTLAKTLTAAFADEASSILIEAHRGARALRSSFVEDLASISTPAAKLARLDDALDCAIDAAVEQRLGDLVPAACLDFERRAAKRASATPAESDDADALLASLEAAVRGALEFDRRRLEALLDACAKLTSTPAWGAKRRTVEPGRAEP